MDTIAKGEASALAIACRRHRQTLRERQRLLRRQTLRERNAKGKAVANSTSFGLSERAITSGRAQDRASGRAQDRASGRAQDRAPTLITNILGLVQDVGISPSF